jgi:hypothetical protein
MGYGMGASGDSTKAPTPHENWLESLLSSTLTPHKSPALPGRIARQAGLFAVPAPSSVTVEKQYKKRSCNPAWHAI